MPSRSDSLRAYRFAGARMSAAAVHGEPDVYVTNRRPVLSSMFAGALVGLLLLAAAGVAGLIGAAVPDWRRTDTLIIDRDTNSRYVYRDGLLHPVLNYVSARLILGSADPPVRRVGHDRLVGVPRGAPWGIPGAPDALPSTGTAIGLPWTVCRGGANGATLTWAVLGRPLTQRPPPSEAVLVESGGNRYLIWQGQQLRIPAGQQTLIALDWGRKPIWRLPLAVLNLVLPGPALEPPPIPDSGKSVTLKNGATYTVGKLFEVRQVGGAKQYYIILRDGYSRIGATTVALLGMSDAEPVAAGELEAIGESQTKVLGSGLPDAIPSPATGNPDQATLCLEYAEGAAGRAFSVRLYDGTPADGTAARAARTVPGDGQTLDWAAVSTDGGGLVKTEGTSDLYLVDDQGRRYAIADDAARVALGLGSVQPLVLPRTVLAVLPTGPNLAREAATAAPPDPSAGTSAGPSTPHPTS
jgi:type VII secretion protein EccB